MSFKAKTIKRPSPRSKWYCFSHSRASRIQKVFLSVIYGARKNFSVFHGPSTLKSKMLKCKAFFVSISILKFDLSFNIYRQAVEEESCPGEIELEKEGRNED